MQNVKEYKADQADWELYVAAMKKPCVCCKEKFEGASWSGRCFNCNELMARPYESGEEYIGIWGN